MSSQFPAATRRHAGIKMFSLVNRRRSIIGRWYFRQVIFWPTITDMGNIAETPDTRRLPPIYGRRPAYVTEVLNIGKTVRSSIDFECHCQPQTQKGIWQILELYKILRFF